MASDPQLTDCKLTQSDIGMDMEIVDTVERLLRATNIPLETLKGRMPYNTGESRASLWLMVGNEDDKLQKPLQQINKSPRCNASAILKLSFTVDLMAGKILFASQGT
jgi:ACT domain-containing protein